MGVFSAGVAAVSTAVVAGASLLSGTPLAPATGFSAPVQQAEIALTGVGADTAAAAAAATIDAATTGATTPALSPFDEGLKEALDGFGIGQQTLPELVADISPGITVGKLLGGFGSGVDTEMGIAKTLDMLGLQNIDIGQVLTALSMPPTATVDDVLAHMQFLGTRLDEILAPLHLNSTETLLGVEQDFGVSDITVDQLLTKLGFSGSETLGQVWNFWGLPSNLISLINTGLVLTACGGADSNSATIDEAITCIKFDGHTLSGSTTLGSVLQDDTMPDGRPLADYTIGEALGFGPNTTIRQFIDNLHVNIDGVSIGTGGTVLDPSDLPALGGVTVSELLTWAGLSPTESLATLIDGFKMGGTTFGDLTLGDALDGMITDPGAMTTSTVEDSTPLVDFLTAMDPLGTLSIDQLLNLSS